MPARPAVSMEAGALHVGVASVGSVEITAWPLESTATQSDVEGHAMPVRAAVSIDVGALQVGVAAFGSVEITASPVASTATHSDVEGHETPSAR
jgi:RNase H-fold protein (predicted Holliday junction resolvase)